MLHNSIARAVALSLSASMAMAIVPTTTAMAEEATGYSVGEPVEYEEGEEHYHYYSYQSRDFSVAPVSVELKEEDVAGMQVFILANSFEGDMSHQKKILFVHGGAFVTQLTTEHLWFAANIAKATDAVVYLPAYPIANEYTDYSDTYPPMTELYRAISDQTPQERFFVMGDSAGAGLCVGLCQQAAKDGMQQPSNLILISPWTNVTVQPWEELGAAAQTWAGSTSQQKNWKVSPTYGDMGGLHKVTIYNGEDDGLAESIEMLYRQMRGNNVDCQLVSTRNAGHDYPYLLPRLEAIRTFNLICTSITGRLSPQDNDMEWFETVGASAFDNGAQSTSPEPKAISPTAIYKGRD